MSIDEVSNEVVVHKPSLPAPGELHRNGHRKLSLTDHVDPVFESLYRSGDEKFIAYLDATDNSEAVEGVVKDDHTMAAYMVREAAPEGSPIKEAHLNQVRSALGSVMKRWGIGRSQRQGAYLAAIESASGSDI